MSDKSEKLEQGIVDFISTQSTLPNVLPEWLLKLGVKPNSKILSCDKIGNKSKDNKTDVLIKLAGCTPIKISAKLSNADYFGNWYGHKRFIDEFGIDTFNKITKAVTDWANQWILKPQSSFFLGVSISFGKRNDSTGERFLNYFSVNDIFSIVKGFEDETLDRVANCLYISNTTPKNVSDFLSNLSPITLGAIENAVTEFKIIYRPVNPMTSGSDRGKNVYTQFIPVTKFDKLTTLTKKGDLIKLGKFFTVDPTCMNHNHIIKNLKSNFNIIIPVKPYTKREKLDPNNTQFISN